MLADAERPGLVLLRGTEQALRPGMRQYALPGNKRGPGAMDVYRARDGQPWVTWNYLSDAGGRKSRTARLASRAKVRLPTSRSAEHSASDPV